MRRFQRSAHLARAKKLAVPDAYLSDERRLFRVLDRRTVDEETLIELEDCATLDVWLVTMGEVARLRVVRAVEADQAREALGVGT